MTNTGNESRRAGVERATIATAKLLRSWGSLTPGTIVNWVPNTSHESRLPTTCIVLGSSPAGKTIVLWDRWGAGWEFHTNVNPDSTIDSDWDIIEPREEGR